MPGNSDAPPFALMTEVSRVGQTGVAMFDRGAGNVNSSSTEYFEDVIDELNGRGSGNPRDLQNDIDAVFGVGNVTLSLGPDDLLTMAVINPLDTLEIIPSPDNTAFGYIAAGHGAAITINAPDNWTRGTIRNKHLGITFTPLLGAPVTAVIPRSAYQSQSMIHMLRERGLLLDADDNHVADNVEALDQALHAVEKIHWGITDDGHVYSAWDTTTGIGDLTWVNTALRDYLGFTGADTYTNYLSASTGFTVRVVVATHPCSGVLVPTRAWESLQPWYNETTRTLELTDGDVVSSHVGNADGWLLSFWLDAQADDRVLWRNWQERFLQYVPLGGRVNLYQQHGDPRRAQATFGAGVTSANAPVYTVLDTPEKDGERGRLRLLRDPRDSKLRNVRPEKLLRRRVRTRMMLRTRIN